MLATERKHIMRAFSAVVLGLVVWSGTANALGQALGTPDRGEPGDRMIQDYLARVTAQINEGVAGDVVSIAEWQARRPRYRDEYFYMLGLDPKAERTPLQPVVTSSLTGDGFIVDMLHYQSRPKLYVTANLYRPAGAKPGEKFPAVLYVCGHSGRGRNGNKTAFQSHGMWFARHGYVCLVVDTLQLGEIAATHHGTYNLNRWWWHSRGYTSAGVECWNGVRGIDYLLSRADVDPERMAVTGISGGGAATFWVAAADERVQVAVPVSGMADLAAYVPNRVINGHCDCMFLYNTFEWPWTRIAALVAPRPMLFVNSDHDGIFPMDANDRISNLLERWYSLYGAGERVDAVVSVGGHDYRHDIRQATFRFINAHLKGDARPVTDTEVDLVIEGGGKAPVHPIDPQKLRVFPGDSDIPADQLNTTIDQHFVPMANVTVPAAGAFDDWKKRLQAELRRVSFRALPERIPAARVQSQESGTVTRLETESGILVRLEKVSGAAVATPKQIDLYVQNAPSDNARPAADWPVKIIESGERIAYRIAPRGTGDTAWTIKNPPNFVRRSHVLLGRTVDAGRVWDVIAAARYLQGIHTDVPVHVAGQGAAGIIAAYAAMWEPEIAGVLVDQPPLTHMDPGAPQFLNVLRVADIPDVLGMVAPRPLKIVGAEADFKKTSAIYGAAGASDRLQIQRDAK